MPGAKDMPEDGGIDSEDRLSKPGLNFVDKTHHHKVGANLHDCLSAGIAKPAQRVGYFCSIPQKIWHRLDSP